MPNIALKDEEYKTVKPRIVCAANRYIITYPKNLKFKDDVLIITGARHWDSVMRGIWDALDTFVIDSIDRNKEEQGFIDQFGNFYTRKEAYIIAKENNQIVRDLGYETDELYSEHLY